tara:strand:- start:294 stop:593 length:300 start_codon:yes stop_codon:yes gene_type:complete
MDICTTILALDPTAKVSVNAEDYNQITWHDGNPNNITVDQIKAKKEELKTAYDNAKYQRDRAEAYPSIPDQLDKIFHDGIDKWKSEMVQPVKDKYPKPE